MTDEYCDGPCLTKYEEDDELDDINQLSAHERANVKKYFNICGIPISDHWKSRNEIIIEENDFEESMQSGTKPIAITERDIEKQRIKNRKDWWREYYRYYRNQLRNLNFSNLPCRTS